MRTSEIAVLAIGSFNIFLLLLAVSTTSMGTIFGVGALVLLFVHLIVIIGALPILLRAIFGRHTISKEFTIVFSIIVMLSSALVLITGQFTSVENNDLLFISLGILELIPILFLYIKRRNVIWQSPPPKLLVFD